MRAAAVFDLDGTLLRGSAERFFLRRAVETRCLRPVQLLRGGAAALEAWIARRVPTPAACKAYLAGADVEPLETLAVDCVDGDLLPRLRPALVARLEAHRAAGATLVLLTGTLDFLGTTIAGRLGIDAVASTSLERRAGRFTGRVLGTYPHGPGKRAILEALAARCGFELGATAAYANRGSDAAHLAAVGAPHAVAPDRRLRRLARSRGWPVLDGLDDGTQGGGPDR